MRSTARLVKVCKETVARLLRVSGRHAERFHAEHVRDLRPLALEFDEQWSFVKKSKNAVWIMNCEEAGDLWDHTAVAADSKLVVSLEVGKRTYDQTLALVQDTKSRLRQGYLPAIFTDAFVSYESALVEVFGRRYPPSGSKPLSGDSLAARVGVWPGEETRQRRSG